MSGVVMPLCRFRANNTSICPLVDVVASSCHPLTNIVVAGEAAYNFHIPTALLNTATPPPCPTFRLPPTVDGGGGGWSLTAGHGHHNNNNQSLEDTLLSGSNSLKNNHQGWNPGHSGNKRKRSWSRAVFSNLQRKGLEIQFQQQKYITKPDRRKLAARLNLTDAQVS